MRALGVELVEHGRDFDEAREHSERLAAEHGYRYVHSGNEPHLIAGVATHTLEALEQEPRLDAIVVPIGGGSGAAGTCVVAKAVSPGCEVIGVQAEQAPAAYDSWRSGAHRRGPDGDLGRGPRDPRRLRVAAGDPARAPRRLRPRRGGRPARCDAADDRAHAQPRRGRGRRAARGRAASSGSVWRGSASRSSAPEATARSTSFDRCSTVRRPSEPLPAVLTAPSQPSRSLPRCARGHAASRSRSPAPLRVSS